MSNGKKRVCIVGGGISGLATAWGLAQHPDRFDFQLYEKNDRVGGNAMTVQIPQDDGMSIPIDVSVTAYIPTVYHHYVTMLERYGIKSLATRFSYTVHYGDGVPDGICRDDEDHLWVAINGGGELRRFTPHGEQVAIVAVTGAKQVSSCALGGPERRTLFVTTTFENLPAEAWSRRGIASDNLFSVRALAYLAVGHVAHHMTIVRERYLQGGSGA